MLIKNVSIENAAQASDIRVMDGKFEEIGPDLAPRAGEEVLDCTGKLVLPPFIESHVHLDTCLTAGSRCGTSPGPSSRASGAGPCGRRALPNRMSGTG